MQFIPDTCHVKMQLDDAIYLLRMGAIDAIYSTKLQEAAHITMNNNGQFVYEHPTITSVIADDINSVVSVLSKDLPNADYYIVDLNRSRNDIHLISKVETITKTLHENDSNTRIKYQYTYHFGYDKDSARLISSIIMRNLGYSGVSLPSENYNYEEMFVKHYEASELQDVPLMWKEEGDVV